jgi:formiminoglutamase
LCNYIIFWEKIFYGKAVAFTKHDLAKITNHRSGEIKFGEKCILPKDTDHHHFKVLASAICISRNPEDIGIRANFWDQEQLQPGTVL